MGRSGKGMDKRTRSLIAMLLVLALMFAIDYFMGDPIDLLGTFADTVPQASQQESTTSPDLEGNLDVYVLDVGQGDSLFLRSPSGKTMLIDASTSDMGDRIDEFLQSQDVTQLDVVIGTHPHADHIGGMKQIISKYDIGTYYMPDAQNNTKMFESLIDELESRDIRVQQAVGGLESFLEWDSETQVQIFSPLPTFDFGDDMNNASVICRVQYGNTSILLTGDAEESAEEAVLKEIPARMLRSTVLKLGHHGSSTSTSDAFLNEVRPALAVASLGAENEYGHPHQETIDKLKDAGIRFLRTDVSGTLHIVLDGKGYSVKTER